MRNLGGIARFLAVKQQKRIDGIDGGNKYRNFFRTFFC